MFKFKRAISLVCAFAVLITSLFTMGIMSVSAAASQDHTVSDGKMLKIVSKKDADISVRNAVDLVAGTEYTVSFDYSFSHAVNYGANESRVKLLVATSLGGGTNDIPGNTVNPDVTAGIHNYTVTFTPSKAYKLLELRLIFNQSNDDLTTYIWNFKVTAKNSDQNLANAIFTVKVNKGTADCFTSEVMDYNGVVTGETEGSYLKVTAPHQNLSGDARVRYVTELKKDTSYTISFNYNFDVDMCKSTTTDTNKRVKFLVSATEGGSASDLTDNEITDGSAILDYRKGTHAYSITFTPAKDYAAFEIMLKMRDVSQTKYPEFTAYLWDFKISENGGEAVAASVADLSVKNNSSSATAVYDFVDKGPDTVFSGKMQKFTLTNNKSARVGNQYVNLKVGKTYTVRFDYYLSQNVNTTNSLLALYRRGDGIKKTDTSVTAKQDIEIARKTGSDLTQGKHTFEQTFTVAPADNYNGTFTVYDSDILSFRFQTQNITDTSFDSVDLYIANYTVTEENSNLNLYGNDWSVYEGSANITTKTVDYEPELFGDGEVVPPTDMTGKMTKFTVPRKGGDMAGETEYNKGLFYNNVELAADKTYTVSFNYYLSEDMTSGANNTFKLLGTLANDYGTSKQGWDISFEGIPSISGTAGKHSFTATFTAATNFKAICLRAQLYSAYDELIMYVWDFTVTEGGNETNLAKEWVCNNSKSKIEIVDYSGALVGEEDGLMQKIDVAKDKDARINKTVDLIKDEKYTVSFDYSLSADLTTANSRFAVLGGKGGSGEYDIPGISAQPSAKAGRHSYSADFTADYNYKSICIRVKPADTNNDGARLYVWNFKVTKKGSSNNLSAGGKWSVNTASGATITAMPFDESLVGIDNTMTKVSAARAFGGKEYNDCRIYNNTAFTKGKNYNISFEYYLSEDLTKGTNNKIAMYGKTAKGDKVFENINNSPIGTKGRHIYSGSFVAAEDITALVLRFMLYSEYDEITAYIWNLKITEDGSNVNLANTSWTSSTATLEKLDYDETLVGGEIAKMTAVVIDNIANQGDYTAKTVNLEAGKEYKLHVKYYLSSDVGLKLKDLIGNYFDFSLTPGLNEITETFIASSADQVKAAIYRETDFDTAAQLYLIDFTLTESDKTENLLSEAEFDRFATTYITDYDDTNFELIKMWQFSLPNGITTNINIYLFNETLAKQKLVVGEEYTLSFDYYFAGCKVGFKVVDITGKHNNESGAMTDDTSGTYYLNVNRKSTYSHTFECNTNKIAPGFNTMGYTQGETLYIWNLQLVKTDDETKTNIISDWNWQNLEKLSSKGIDISKVNRDESLFKVDDTKLNDGNNMLKFDSYYYDKDTQTIKVDQEVFQRFGINWNGVEIKPNTTYVFSFDYYVTEDNVSNSAIYKTLYTHYPKSNQHLWTTPIGGNQTKRGILLDNCRGTFSKEFTTKSDQTDFCLGFAQGVFGYSYYWNIKLVEKGSDVNIFPNSDFSQGFKYWYHPLKSDDTSVGTDQATIMTLDAEMVALELGGLLPDTEKDFYLQDLWGDEKKDDETDYENNLSDSSTNANTTSDSNTTNDNNYSYEGTQESDGDGTYTVQQIIKRRKKKSPVQNDGLSVTSIVLIAVAAVLVAGGAATAVIIMLRKKKKLKI